MRTRHHIIRILALLFSASCETTNLTPVGKSDNFQLEEDERRLWNRSLEEQQRLDSSTVLYGNPTWVTYVNQVAQRLIPEDAKGKGLQIQIRIIKNPLLNAFAYPQGVIYVHTGLLAKMENEAQLATLLGHEMTHALHRHAIQNVRSVKNKAAVFAGFQVITLPFGIVGSLASLLGAVGTMAAVTGYSRELETEADQNGLELMVRAGYESTEAPKLFEHLKRDVEEQKVTEPFFFGTHPRLQERIDNYRSLLESAYKGAKGDIGTDRFMAKIFPLLLDNAVLDIAMGRFQSAERGLAKALEREPDNAQAHYYLGEVYRQRAQEGDKEKAEKEYDLAVKYNPTYAQPHKGLGLLAYKKGLKEKARAELGTYLSLAPSAEDRGYIEQYLKALDSK